MLNTLIKNEQSQTQPKKSNWRGQYRPLKKLSPRHKAYCIAYVATGSASKAYAQVYCNDMPHTNKKDDKKEYHYAWTLLQDPLIRQEIDRVSKDLAMSEAEIEGMYAAIARRDTAADKDRLHALDSQARILGMMHDNNINLGVAVADTQFIEQLRNTIKSTSQVIDTQSLTPTSDNNSYVNNTLPGSESKSDSNNNSKCDDVSSGEGTAPSGVGS